MTGDYIYSRLSSDVLGGIRQRLFDHLQSLSLSVYQKYSSGEISARYSTDLAGVEQTLSWWIPWEQEPALDVIGFNVVMLREVPRSATIHTQVPCVFLTLQRQHFQQLLGGAPTMRIALLGQELTRAASV
jgi:ABC-type multidrug transport system fused ATPase/permease subunit